MGDFKPLNDQSKSSYLKIIKRLMAIVICLLGLVLMAKYNFAQVNAEVQKNALSSPVQKTLTPPNAVPVENTVTVVTPVKPLVTNTNNDATPHNETTTPPVENNINKMSDTITQPGKISFYFQNVPTRTLLQLIGKNSELNFIISDKVIGTTTLNLKNVTWLQALDIVMQSNGLAKKEMATAIYISTLEDISNIQTKEYEAEQNTLNLSPLSTILIPLKYSDAAELAKVLKSSDGSLLTKRGDVSINNPTNTIIIRDVATNLSQIKKYIKKLDIPARQVSIEARIVNIDASYEGQLGVRFGVTRPHSLTGTLAGANQMRAGNNPVNISPIDNRLNFNIPANLLSTGAIPASVGLALAKLGPVLLDLELSALEQEGHTQVISKPRIVTANQQKAMILTGEEIPYQQSTSSGATSIEFKKAVLSLEVIPQITPDNKIILKLKANQDTRGSQLLVAQQQVTTSSGTTGDSSTVTTVPAVFGPPTINTQQVESQVLLNNNETVVIGGIYKLTKQSTFDRVPFFGSLPLVGGLFKHRGIHNEKNELLIFLTPRIITQEERHIAYKGEG